MHNNSNQNSKSFSNLGSSYLHKNYEFGSYEAKTFVAGTEKFTVNEIEVFTTDRNLLKNYVLETIFLHIILFSLLN